MTTRGLIGRDREVGVIDAMIDDAHTRGGVLVVRGEAGIGKSALLAAAAARARDRAMLVLTATGVQSETYLPFAGLHQLLRPVLSGLDALPAPQRSAVQAAFGITDAAAPDLFLIALATLNLLGEAAAQTPILLLAEDAHWLDRPTADVLAFVARRVEADPIIVLCALRDGVDASLARSGLPEVRLEALSEDEAGALLDAHAPALDGAIRTRLLSEAAGNPLALVELPAALASARLETGAGLPLWLPLTTRLEQAFAARVTALPPTTRTLLQVAAINDRGSLAEIVAASAYVEGVEPPIGAFEPAITARLIVLDGTDLHFYHPLVRSAIYQATRLPQRHAAHAALAWVLVDQPDRRAWHLAASTAGVHEEAAAGLDAAAGRARRRGAIAVAMAAYERAARLSVNVEGRVSRLLRAAELSAELGQPRLFTQLTGEIASLDLSVPDHARLLRIREMVDPGIVADPARIALVVETAERVNAAGDPDLALTLLMLAASRISWGSVAEETRQLVLAAAEHIPEQNTHPWLLAVLALAAPIARSAVVFDRLSRRTPAGVDAEALRMLGTAAWSIGDYDRAALFLASAVSGLRAEGRLGLLARALVMQALGEVHRGNWDVALTAADEGERLAREIGQQLTLARALVAKAIVAGLQGDEARADVLIVEIEHIARSIHADVVLTWTHLVRSLTALGGGRHADAYALLRPPFDGPSSDDSMIGRVGTIGYLAEAAVRCGQRDAARHVLGQMERLAVQTPSPWLHAGMRFARALLAGDQDADHLFQAALNPDLVRWPFMQARVQLAHGAWLRRQRRVADCRLALRAARETFDALGARYWSEEARRELRATGETSPQRAPNVMDLLTPQELQIAQFAAAGHSNREIGTRLYLSHRTVSTHLHHIFPKLGITSRAELHAALGITATPAT